jgi:hypothetical protein
MLSSMRRHVLEKQIGGRAGIRASDPPRRLRVNDGTPRLTSNVSYAEAAGRGHYRKHINQK